MATRGLTHGTDWAIYERLKMAAIPNYNPYQSPSKSKGGGTNEMDLAARYAALSATAMSTSAIITNPIEIVRTRWQTSGGDANRPVSLLSMIQDMWRQAGWRAFMRGAMIRGIYYVRDTYSHLSP